jgi:hypothetical protein
VAVHDGLGNEVLRGDHLERVLLTARLVAEKLRDLWINLADGLGEVVRSQIGHRQHGTSAAGAELRLSA